jgi:tRNA-2-methylthio-N6-dimethylallyladenosine synthase
MSKKIYIKTLGCQMNEYDSNRIIDTVKEIGFFKTENLNDTDCFLLNTCHIRDKAKEKVYHEIGRVKKNFKSKKKPLVIVAGCVAQAENEEMLKREPYIDIVIGFKKVVINFATFVLFLLLEGPNTQDLLMK